MSVREGGYGDFPSCFRVEALLLQKRSMPDEKADGVELLFGLEDFCRFFGRVRLFLFLVSRTLVFRFCKVVADIFLSGEFGRLSG